MGFQLLWVPGAGAQAGAGQVHGGEGRRVAGRQHRPPGAPAAPRAAAAGGPQEPRRARRPGAGCARVFFSRSSSCPFPT